MGCRVRGPRSTLVRLVAVAAVVTVDLTASQPGRGAWLHPDVRCLDRAIRQRAIPRALRQPVQINRDEIAAELARYEPPNNRESGGSEMTTK